MTAVRSVGAVLLGALTMVLALYATLMFAEQF
jgi:hypothetical protein